MDSIMARLIFYVISCSADEEMDIRNLYVWGEGESAKWLPDTKREARRRIAKCYEKNKCDECDAQVHPAEVNRTK